MLPASKIKIQCPHCNKEFKEQAKKIRGGARIPCPLCKRQIAFVDSSSDESIRRALSAARQIRRESSVLQP
jgi:Zn finger protein HypA/HybF involved in hydrogenase expression